MTTQAERPPLSDEDLVRLKDLSDKLHNGVQGEVTKYILDGKVQQEFTPALIRQLLIEVLHARALTPAPLVDETQVLREVSTEAPSAQRVARKTTPKVQ